MSSSSVIESAGSQKASSTQRLSPWTAIRSYSMRSLASPVGREIPTRYSIALRGGAGRASCTCRSRGFIGSAPLRHHTLGADTPPNGQSVAISESLSTGRSRRGIAVGVVIALAIICAFVFAVTRNGPTYQGTVVATNELCVIVELPASDHQPTWCLPPGASWTAGAHVGDCYEFQYDSSERVTGGHRERC